MKDKRRFPRYDCSFAVRYTTRGTASLESMTIAEDISRSGIRLPISRMVKAGDVLALYIYPKEESGAISATGIVKWIQQRPKEQKLNVDAGIQFTDIESNDADRLIPVKHT